MSLLPTGSTQPRIVLVTCRRWPALSPSDQRYAAALRALGAHVVAAAWNVGEDQPEFRAADLVTIRASWDYHDALEAYQTWLSQLEAEGIRVQNDPALVRRFLDKTAFTELAGDDVATPRPGEFRTNSAFAPDVELLVPLPEAVGRIEALVRRIGIRPLYARVDVVMRAETPVLLEFEVNEPGLWLDLAPPAAAEAFARATLARLQRA